MCTYGTCIFGVSDDKRSNVSCLFLLLLLFCYFALFFLFSYYYIWKIVFCRRNKNPIEANTENFRVKKLFPCILSHVIHSKQEMLSVSIFFWFVPFFIPILLQHWIDKRRIKVLQMSHSCYTHTSSYSQIAHTGKIRTWRIGER